jgi:hypothetical protein
MELKTFIWVFSSHKFNNVRKSVSADTKSFFKFKGRSTRYIKTKSVEFTIYLTIIFSWIRSERYDETVRREQLCVQKC